MHRLVVALSIAGTLAACAVTPAVRSQVADSRSRDDAKVAAELKGLTPSPPQDCIDSRRLRAAVSEPYGDTILYRLGPNLVYRNDTGGGCIGLARGETLVDNFYPGDKSRSGQMCRGDALYSRDVRVSAPSGECTRGAWIAYTK